VLGDLKLVYDEDGDRIAVADTTGSIVGEVLTFGFPTVVANSVDSQRNDTFTSSARV
jgi:hypothetical protein